MQGWENGRNRGFRRRAFTLAEVMVAFGVMAVASSGIYGTVLMSKRMLQQSRYHSEAEAVAMDKLLFVANSYSYAQLCNWPMVPLSTPAAYTDTAPAFNQRVHPSSILYNRSGTVYVGTAVSDDHVTVTVRVWWAGRVGEGDATAAFEQLSVDRYPITR